MNLKYVEQIFQNYQLAVGLRLNLIKRIVLLGCLSGGRSTNGKSEDRKCDDEVENILLEMLQN